MNDTVPYTNYSVKLVACTKGGCTESEDDVQITTFEEGKSHHKLLSYLSVEVLSPHGVHLAINI